MSYYQASLIPNNAQTSFVLSKSQKQIHQYTEIQQNSDINESIKQNKGEFKIKFGKLLGKGGFGKCYEAFFYGDQTTKVRKCAVKVVKKSNLQKNQSQLKRFKHQLFIHKRLSYRSYSGKKYYETEQSRIVTLLDWYQDQFNVYMVMELCEPQNLEDILDQRIRLEFWQAQIIFRQLLEGVRYIHSCGIIHRDLKPGNILLKKDPKTQLMHIKIGDFGLARKIVKKVNEQEVEYCPVMSRCGSPNYISPELLNDQGQLFEVDIWALGVILYQMTFGYPPFYIVNNLQETYKKIKNCKYNYPSQIENELKTIIDNIIGKQNPKQRTTIQQLLDNPYFDISKIPTHLYWQIKQSALKLTKKEKVNWRNGQDNEVSQFQYVLEEEKYTNKYFLTNCNIMQFKINKGEIHIQYAFLYESKTERQYITYVLSDGTFGIHYEDGQGIFRNGQNIFKISQGKKVKIKKKQLSQLFEVSYLSYKKQIHSLKKEYQQEYQKEYQKETAQTVFVEKWKKYKHYVFIRLNNKVEQIKFIDRSILIFSFNHQNIHYIGRHPDPKCVKIKFKNYQDQQSWQEAQTKISLFRKYLSTKIQKQPHTQQNQQDFIS